MAKIKAKNIDFIADELKNKFNGMSINNNLKIGVVACVDCFERQSYALSLAEIVKSEIIKNSTECEIVTLPAINERFRVFSRGNYVLNAYKNQITNLLELVLSEKSFDGLVFIPSGLECAVGCVLSSIRLNLPTLFLTQGLSVTRKGFNLNDILSCPGEIAQGKTSIFDFENKQKKFCEFSGTGCTFTAENIFGAILEIMELSTKNSSVFAQTFEKETQARETAKTIVELAKNRLPLKKMINRKSMNNAIMLNFCLGGSPYVIDVLMQISKEADLELDINKILASGKNVPVLFDTNLGLEKFDEFGGTWGLLRAMIKNKIIDGDYKTFSDTTLTEETKKTMVFENFLTPVKKESLIVMRGNIAERYALAKTLNVPESITKVLTNIQVFSDDQEACNAVLNKALTDNCAIVIKECGKKTDAGVSTISQTPLALQSMGLEKNHIVITDGFVIDDTKAICISCVCPDSTGGNIRCLKDGDEIEIDFVKGKLNAEIANREFSIRQKKYIKENKILPKFLQK